MSLLTEEQFNDILDITNVCGTSLCATNLRKWNEKQHPAQFEPDWKKISSKVKTCHLRQYYFDSEGNEIDWDYIFSYERPVTAHPHAALIAKYAEAAARRVDPWAEFQVHNHHLNCWVTLDRASYFGETQNYRHIGETK